MTKKIATWIGLALMGLLALYLIVNIASAVFENVEPGTVLAGGVIGTVGIVLLAVILLPVLFILLALRIAKNEKFGWAHAAAIIAILVVLGGLYWYADKRASRLEISSGGSTSVPGVNTDGLGGLGEFPVPPPGIPRRGSPGATSWDPTKPPMVAEPKAPAFALASGLDNSKPFNGGHLTQARWCEMCASGKLRQKSYDRLKCTPELCSK